MRLSLTLCCIVAAAVMASSTAPACPGNQQWQECPTPPACAPTCQNAKLGMACPMYCLAGCACPTGLMLDETTNGMCVETCPPAPAGQCTLADGAVKSSGDAWNDECNSCSCADGKSKCVRDMAINNCPTGKVCKSMVGSSEPGICVEQEATCTVGALSYSPGSTWTQGCNTCTCSNEGKSTCSPTPCTTPTCADDETLTLMNAGTGVAPSCCDVYTCPKTVQQPILGADCGSRGPCPAPITCADDETLTLTTPATGVAPSCCDVYTCPKTVQQPILGADCGSRGPCPAPITCADDETLTLTTPATGVAPSCCDVYTCPKTVQQPILGADCGSRGPCPAPITCADDETLTLTTPATGVAPSCCDVYTCPKTSTVSNPIVGNTCGALAPCSPALPCPAGQIASVKTKATGVPPLCCNEYECVTADSSHVQCSAVACATTMPLCTGSEFLEKFPATGVFPDCCDRYMCAGATVRNMCANNAEYCVTVAVDFAQALAVSAESACASLTLSASVSRLCTYANDGRRLLVAIGSAISNGEVADAAERLRQLIVSHTLQEQTAIFASATNAQVVATSQRNNNNNKSDGNTGVIVGAVVAGAVAVILIALAIVKVVRTKRTSSHSFERLSDEVSPGSPSSFYVAMQDTDDSVVNAETAIIQLE